MTHTTGIAALLVAATLTIVAAQDTSLPAFEVVSVKRTSAPYQERNGIVPTPGRFSLEKAPASLLIGYAYRGEFDDVRGTPEWATKDFYNVVAPVPAGTPQPQIQLMVRRLLQERFHLAVHTEQAEREVLALVRTNPDAPLPKGFEKVDVDCVALAASGQPFAPLNLKESMPPCRMVDTGVEVTSGGLPLQNLANMLRGHFEQQIVDRTQLAGNYRFTLHYTFTGRGARIEPTDTNPDIVTALREQLGLKVTPTKINARILVVDRFDPPDPD
jgi:uncharacterized protein (TIGR03435 family)